MAKAFAAHKLITCIHKHYSVEEWVEFAAQNPEVVSSVAVSCGTSDAEFEKLKAIMAVVDVPFVCIDVANGYSEYVSVYILTNSALM